VTVSPAEGDGLLARFRDLIGPDAPGVAATAP
jgi:hypothetical protein